MANKKEKFRKNSLLVLLAITAVLAFVVFMFVQQNRPASEAAKGGGGGKGGHVQPPTTAGTLSVSPNPVAAGGATYTITGSGFTAGATIQIFIYEPDNHFTGGQAVTDASGNLGPFTGVTNVVGTYRVDAAVVSNSKQLTVVASTSFQASAP